MPPYTFFTQINKPKDLEKGEKNNFLVIIKPKIVGTKQFFSRLYTSMEFLYINVNFLGIKILKGVLEGKEGLFDEACFWDLTPIL